MLRLLVALTMVAGAGALSAPEARAQAAPRARAAVEAAEPAGAQAGAQADARKHFEAGVELAQRKEFAAAARRFEQAYALDPTLDALFAWAQAERLGGRCAAAMPLYREFLARGPAPDHEQAAQIGLRRCAEAEGAAAPARAERAEAPAPPRAPDSVAARPAPPATDWLAGSLIALGTVGAGAGLALVALSVNEDNAAGAAGLYEDYLRHMERARFQRTLGIGVGAAGAVLATIGVVRLFTPPRAEGPVTVAIAPGAGRSLVLLRGAF